MVFACVYTSVNVCVCIWAQTFYAKVYRKMEGNGGKEIVLLYFVLLLKKENDKVDKKLEIAVSLEMLKHEKTRVINISLLHLFFFLPLS